MFDTSVVVTESGDRGSANANWQTPLWTWTLQFVRHSDDFGDLLGFFLARMGQAYGFFFKDPLDYSSDDNNGEGLVKTIATASGNKRYLVKKYPDSDDYNPFHRIIKRPILGTVVINGDVGGTPVVNYSTGEVTGASTDGTASFEFVNPVVFVTDVMNIDRDPATGEWADIVLNELRNYVLAT